MTEIMTMRHEANWKRTKRQSTLETMKTKQGKKKKLQEWKTWQEDRKMMMSDWMKRRTTRKAEEAIEDEVMTMWTMRTKKRRKMMTRKPEGW